MAVMISAELDTCSDTLLATINESRQALKIGLLYVTFNQISIILGLILFYPFMAFVIQISGEASIERTLPNANMLFNIFRVSVFVWTIPIFEKVLDKILPDKKDFS